MFTGLVEAVCTVKSVVRTADSLRLEVNLASLATDVKIGDSIAIDGACLTTVSLRDNAAAFDVSNETLAKSTLGSLKTASAVNVERAMKAGDRFGGHFVQGHIDGKAKIEKIEKKGNFRDITFSAPAELLEQMVTKGSITIDGISLTIAQMNQKIFKVAIIPQTWKKTTLNKKSTSDQVNIEIDIIVKTIKKQIQHLAGPKQELTIEKLKEMGF